MKEREITEDEAETVVKDPEYVEPSVKGRENAFRFMNGRFLRVTYRKESGAVFVVTVVKRQKPFERG